MLSSNCYQTIALRGTLSVGDVQDAHATLAGYPCVRATIISYRQHQKNLTSTPKQGFSKVVFPAFGGEKRRKVCPIRSMPDVPHTGTRKGYPYGLLSLRTLLDF